MRDLKIKANSSVYRLNRAAGIRMYDGEVRKDREQYQSDSIHIKKAAEIIGIRNIDGVLAIEIQNGSLADVAIFLSPDQLKQIIEQSKKL